MGGPEHRNTTTKINEHRKKSPRNTVTATIIFIYIIFIPSKQLSKINASKRMFVNACLRVHTVDTFRSVSGLYLP